MAVITIDGIRLEVPDGKNVLECALDAGIYIPHLCHHKDLLPLGSCRMCIVEVEGEEKPVPSCKLQAKDGLVISTQTDEVKRLRMLALELLLAGHPEDCSTCPKYGNCELQMLIQYIGPKTGRLKMRTKGFAANDANPLILHDMNRCVLCGRCVRVCKDMRGVNVLHYQKREDLEVYMGTLHEKLLKDANCRFCQACAEVCPTGTIRDKLANSEVRKEDYVVYLKEGDAILDFLAMAGAEESATVFEAARNVKEVRNQVNRLVNCETANLNKTAKAAARLKTIRFISG